MLRTSSPRYFLAILLLLRLGSSIAVIEAAAQPPWLKPIAAVNGPCCLMASATVPRKRAILGCDSFSSSVVHQERSRSPST